MSELEQIENELKIYLTKEPNLSRSERLAYLMTIFGRMFTFRKFDHVISAYELNNIISGSKSAFANLSLPLHVSKKQMDPSQLNHIAMIESITSYLNRHDLLKKVPKMEYTDAGSEFESYEDI